MLRAASDTKNRTALLTSLTFANYGTSYAPEEMSNTYALTGCHTFGNGTPPTLLPGQAVVGCLEFAYSASKLLVGAKLWYASGWLSDGSLLGRLYHWALNGPPWSAL